MSMLSNPLISKNNVFNHQHSVGPWSHDVDNGVAVVMLLVERGSGGTAYRDIDFSVLREATSPTHAYFPRKKLVVGQISR